MDQATTRIRESMAELGVHLRRDWVKHCLRAQTDTDGGESVGRGGRRRWQQAEMQEEVYRTFLACDLRETGEGCFPAGVAEMVKERIKGKMVVQVENARDIAKSSEQRENTDGGFFHHTLKLALGDGIQTVAAFEYRRIQGLAADPPPGLKLLLIEPWVRRGILLLSSENTTVLGGEVASLVEARKTARAGGGRNKTPGAPTSTVGAAHGQQQHQQPGRVRAVGTAGERGVVHTCQGGAAGSNGGGAEAAAERNPAREQAGGGRGWRPPGDGENAAPAGPVVADHVVDLSSSSPPSLEGSAGPLSSSLGRRRGHDNAGESRLHQPEPPAGAVFNPYAALTQPGLRSGAAAGPVLAGAGGSEGGEGGKGGRASNPYSVTARATPNAAVEPVWAARNESWEGLGGAARSGDGDPRGRNRGVGAQVPAFRDDMEDDDDGPGFDYLEEPDFDDFDGVGGGREEEEEPPDDVVGQASKIPVVESSVPPLPSTPLPRPKIVSARLQHERLREEEEQEQQDKGAERGEGGEAGGGRRTCRAEGWRNDGRGGSATGAGAGAGDAGIEGYLGRESEKRSGGLAFPRRKRGRDSGSQVDEPEGDRAEERDHRPPAPAQPSGPYTSLEDLDRLMAAGEGGGGGAGAGGVFRVKAVVSDTKCCKIRKKKYLLAVEIEDGTAVVRVRFSEQITKRLFGVDAREYKKMYQTNFERAKFIQARVEKEIKQMEGVMEIYTSAAATATSQQSPTAPETPGSSGVAPASASQSSAAATDDPEWLLPVVTSVQPPTDQDCRDLLSRLDSLL